MQSFENFIACTTKWIGSAVLVLMALQIVIDVFMRNVLGAGFPATAELVSKYYMIAVSFLPIAFAELQRRHVEATIFTDMMPVWSRNVVYFIGFALSLIMYTLLFYGTATEALVQTKRRAYVEAGTMDFITWPGYWILPLCFGLMVLVLILRLYQVFTGTFQDATADAFVVARQFDEEI
jgi:TRAP-type C4-dicarboxylate transport system permease small subunit